VQAKVVTAATNQALEARRNYLMSWPQYEREVQQRSDLLRVNEAADKRKVELALQDMKLDWAKRVETMRSSLDAFYVKLRAALRDSGFTTKTFDGAGGGSGSSAPAIPAIPAIPAPTTTQPVPAVPQGMLKNSLGMRFVSLPGTNVLICIHETRYKDFAAYAAKNPDIGTSWEQGNLGITRTVNAGARNNNPVVAGKERVFGQRRIEPNADDPVVEVTWEQAKKFCEWLSQKEAKTYRLPTDAEWSIAVGIDKGERWNKNTTPSNVWKNPTLFPWGTEWPPPPFSGNYLDYSRTRLDPKLKPVVACDDGFPYTAPVMSFKSNKLGIYDLEGNVEEWVEDWWDSEKKEHVSRGATYWGSARESFLASHRMRHPSGTRGCGFRVVVENDR
jgi:formylglycine-generating enzyme required for sulfatase activity